MKKISTRARVLLAVSAAAAVAAVAGYAYFTSTGTGSGSATVGAATNWTVDVADVDGGPLYPGSGIENKTYEVTNAGAGNQLLNSVTIEIANADGTPWDGTGSCSKDDFSINGGAAGATATDTYGAVPADDYAFGAGTGPVAFTVEMVDTELNQDDCQNETPPILVSAS